MGMAANYDSILTLEKVRYCFITLAPGRVEQSINSPKFDGLNPVTASTCDLYYKHITIINDDSSFINKWCHSLEHHLLMMPESSFMIIMCL
jgi:hypothetical protein